MCPKKLLFMAMAAATAKVVIFLYTPENSAATNTVCGVLMVSGILLAVYGAIMSTIRFSKGMAHHRTDWCIFIGTLLIFITFHK